MVSFQIVERKTPLTESAAPARALEILPPFLESKVWQLRVYAAHAAAALNDRVGLEKLARDEDDNVSEAAIQGLAHVAGHEIDGVYLLAMHRTGLRSVSTTSGSSRSRSAKRPAPLS